MWIALYSSTKSFPKLKSGRPICRAYNGAEPCCPAEAEEGSWKANNCLYHHSTISKGLQRSDLSLKKSLASDNKDILATLRWQSILVFNYIFESLFKIQLSIHNQSQQQQKQVLFLQIHNLSRTKAPFSVLLTTESDSGQFSIGYRPVSFFLRKDYLISAVRKSKTMT